MTTLDIWVMKRDEKEIDNLLLNNQQLTTTITRSFNENIQQRNCYLLFQLKIKLKNSRIEKVNSNKRAKLQSKMRNM